MLISRNDPRYYFSEDQYLSDEQYDAIRAEYKQRVVSETSGPVRFTTPVRNSPDGTVPASMTQPGMPPSCGPPLTAGSPPTTVRRTR